MHQAGCWPGENKVSGEFIRVNVDPNNLSLQVARCGDKDLGWSYLRDPIMLPADVLNVSTRTVPKDFVLLDLPECLTDYTPNKPERGRQGRKPSSMEVSSQNEWGRQPLSLLALIPGPKQNYSALSRSYHHKHRVQLPNVVCFWNLCPHIHISWNISFRNQL